MLKIDYKKEAILYVREKGHAMLIVKNDIPLEYTSKMDFVDPAIRVRYGFVVFSHIYYPLLVNNGLPLLTS